MKTFHILLILFVLSGFTLHAAKKPDANSLKLPELSSANTTELSTDYVSAEKGKVLVQMFHNDENVKVQILVPDESTKMKFLMQGLKVYLDISGKKSKKYYVQFPKMERGQMQGNRQQQREADQQNTNPQRRMNMDMMQILMQMNANFAELVKGKNKTILDAEKAKIKPTEDN